MNKSVERGREPLRYVSYARTSVARGGDGSIRHQIAAIATAVRKRSNEEGGPPWRCAGVYADIPRRARRPIV